ncbi:MULTISPECIES: hypothetical protein [Sphingobium]|uniref:hypothetical protein n=1 Tax=Sphingobium TaxID=165695 RepID=UPI001BE66096|nr:MULTISPECIES: hypothetical protein [Sphingobium]MBT2245046.1 hypothetical protein [Sphingobium sp. BHU LFT2]WBQ19404.1 hypothetical protein PAE53_23800 [Sphingobium yanoikuyae]
MRKEIFVAAILVQLVGCGRPPPSVGPENAQNLSINRADDAPAGSQNVPPPKSGSGKVPPNFERKDRATDD